jgi:hypothetical protein
MEGAESHQLVIFSPTQGANDFSACACHGEPFRNLACSSALRPEPREELRDFAALSAPLGGSVLHEQSGQVLLVEAFEGFGGHGFVQLGRRGRVGDGLQIGRAPE